MAILNIRNIPDEVHVRLRIRAATAGRSMEAEARAIVADACMRTERRAPPVALQALIDELYGDARPRGVVEALIAARRRQGLFG